MDRLRHRPRRLRRARLACLSGGFLAVISAWAGPPPPEHIRNFGVVDQTLYRGAEPSAIGLQELSAKGIKLVIDLRESGQSTLLEKQEVQQLGMKYLNVPFPPLSAPTSEQMRTVLFLLMNRGNNAIFVHCRRGKDRTGTVIACYRMQHDGWKNVKALEEAREYGMSWTERGMRSFVLSFSPLPNAGLIPAGSPSSVFPAHP